MPELEHLPVVLIAEDNENDVAMLRRALEQLSFAGHVQFVADGEQGIAYLSGEARFARRSEFPLPDFLLLDLKMPRKNGFEVLQWIQGQPTLAQLRTVVLTTTDDMREVTRAYLLGAASFLVKPVNFTEFKDTIQALTNYWLFFNKHALLYRPKKSAASGELAALIRSRHNVRSIHTQTVLVSLLGPGHTSWHHNVEIFDLIAHPRARKCFAWRGPDAQPVIVLGTSEITSAEEAVRSVYHRQTI
jgi:CheY-like chemotaxis protein